MDFIRGPYFKLRVSDHSPRLTLLLCFKVSDDLVNSRVTDIDKKLMNLISVFA